MRQAIMLLHNPRLVAVVTVVLAGLSACGTDTVTMSNTGFVGNDAFVRVARNALSTDWGSAGSDGYVSQDNENFYLAINKEQLGQKWFLSGYLTQWHPSQNIPVRVLGTRVVTFKVQNGKLFVFDATDGKAWSDELDPTVVDEGVPPGHRLRAVQFSQFIELHFVRPVGRVEPLRRGRRPRGVEHVRAVSGRACTWQPLAPWPRISYEQVFTGYHRAAAAGRRGARPAVSRLGHGGHCAARREGDGFVARERVKLFRIGSSNVQYVKNSYNLKQYAVKWNIKPGMKPISWRLSKSLAVLKADPRLAGVDVEGAFARGITGWNDAFGFQVFKVEPTDDDDSYGDDDGGFVVIDNRAHRYLFANCASTQHGRNSQRVGLFLEHLHRGVVVGAGRPGRRRRHGRWLGRRRGRWYG